MMNFQFTGLDTAEFSHLFELSATELAEHQIASVIADADQGYPCRVTLQDVPKDSRLLLLNYKHLPKPGPYQSQHAIFVSEASHRAELAPNVIPATIINRQVSIRSFDSQQMMLDARVAKGEHCADVIREFFQQPEADFVHVHTAMRGCFLAAAFPLRDD